MIRYTMVGAAITAALIGAGGPAGAEEPTAKPEKPATEELRARPQLKPWLLAVPPNPPSAAIRQRAFNYRLNLQRGARTLERKLHEGRAGREAFDPLMRSRSEIDRIHRARRK